MKSLFKSMALFLLVFAIMSCAGLTREQTNQWLNSINGSSDINMTGKWDAGGMVTGGWGEGNFIQEGRYFSGTLGMYNVDGVVSGKEVYMAITSGSRAYYTARLRQFADGTITGKAVENTIIDEKEFQNAASYLISLKRMK